MPQDSLTHREVEEVEAFAEPTDQVETPDVNEESVTTNDEFIIYNLDDVPEPEDLTPQAPTAESNTQETEATQPAASQPSVQPLVRPLPSDNGKSHVALLSSRANSTCQGALPIWKTSPLTSVGTSPLTTRRRAPNPKSAGCV